MSHNFVRNTLYTTTRPAAVIINRKGYELPAGVVCTFTGEYDKRTNRAAFQIEHFPGDADTAKDLILTTFRIAVDVAEGNLKTEAELTAGPKKKKSKAATGPKTLKYNYPEGLTKAQKKALRRKLRAAARKPVVTAPETPAEAPVEEPATETEAAPEAEAVITAE